MANGDTIGHLPCIYIIAFLRWNVASGKMNGNVFTTYRQHSIGRFLVRMQTNWNFSIWTKLFFTCDKLFGVTLIAKHFGHPFGEETFSNREYYISRRGVKCECVFVKLWDTFFDFIEPTNCNKVSIRFSQFPNILHFNSGRLILYQSIGMFVGIFFCINCINKLIDFLEIAYIV